MNLSFDISGDPLSLANIKTCALASKLAYTQPTFIDPATGESVLIQAVGRRCCAAQDGEAAASPYLEGSPGTPDALLIAFPGTHDFRDVLRDLDCLRESTIIRGRLCSVHKGFAKTHAALMPSILAEVNPALRLFVTGHSKGAAVARRCALALIENNLPVAGLITFGEPRGGDSRYSLISYDALRDRDLRITNAADPVPWLPAWLAGNRHCGPEGFMPARKNVLITGPALLSKLWSDGREIYQAWQLKELTPLSDHHIDNYLRRIDALQSAPNVE